MSLEEIFEFGMLGKTKKLFRTGQRKLKGRMSKLSGGQEAIIGEAAKLSPDKAASLQKGMQDSNFRTNKKIAVWGGLPPIAATAASIAVGSRGQKKSEERIVRAINAKKTTDSNNTLRTEANAEKVRRQAKPTSFEELGELLEFARLKLRKTKSGAVGESIKVTSGAKKRWPQYIDKDGNSLRKYSGFTVHPETGAPYPPLRGYASKLKEKLRK